MSGTRSTPKGMRIITNADDLGYSSKVNEEIFTLAEEGLVTSSTLLANAPACREACARVQRFPRCSFGVHLNLTEFRPLSDAVGLGALLGPDGSFVNGRVREVANLRPLHPAIYLEFCTQIDFLQAHGVPVVHLDSHHHVHTIPALFPVLKAVQRRYGIRRVRISLNVYNSADPRGTRRLLFKKWVFNTLLRCWFPTRTADAFSDLTAFAQKRALISAKYSTIEIMLHPGGPKSELETLALKSIAATDPDFRRSLIPYRDL